MKTKAGQTYRREWQTLATYLHTQWPGLRQGSTVATAIWLLEYLRKIEMSGILPSYDSEGQLVRTVGTEVALAGMLRQEATGTHELLMSQHGETQERV